MARRAKKLERKRSVESRESGKQDHDEALNARKRRPLVREYHEPGVTVTVTVAVAVAVAVAVGCPCAEIASIFFFLSRH